MTEGYGAQGMVGRLRRVVMRRPGEAMAAADPAAWHYTSAIDVDEARRAHDALADALRAWGVEVLYHDEPLPDHSDSVFVFDPVLVTEQGTLVLSMGKERRRGEEEALARTLQDCGVPVFGRLEGDARAEGGDTLWLDHDTLAVGRGFRTNAEGVRQLRGLLEPVGVTVVDFDLPVLHRPGGVSPPAEPRSARSTSIWPSPTRGSCRPHSGRSSSAAASGSSRYRRRSSRTRRRRTCLPSLRAGASCSTESGDAAAARDGRL